MNDTGHVNPDHMAPSRAGSLLMLLLGLLLLAGIVMMALLVFVVGYFIIRTLLRELTVARLQSDFVAAVSHEFRTPLTTVRQLSEMLVRGRVSSDERRQEFYGTLLRESDRLHKLVEGLLDFARFETGAPAYSFETIEAGEFVRRIVAEFEQRVTPQGFRILALFDTDPAKLGRRFGDAEVR